MGTGGGWEPSGSSVVRFVQRMEIGVLVRILGTLCRSEARGSPHWILAPKGPLTPGEIMAEVIPGLAYTACPSRSPHSGELWAAGDSTLSCTPARTTRGSSAARKPEVGFPWSPPSPCPEDSPVPLENILLGPPKQPVPQEHPEACHLPDPSHAVWPQASGSCSKGSGSGPRPRGSPVALEL